MPPALASFVDDAHAVRVSYGDPADRATMSGTVDTASAQIRGHARHARAAPS